MNSIYSKLLEIKKELEKCEKEKSKVLQYGIDLKLNRTTNLYNKAVELNCDYILSRSNYKALKAMDRYNKKKEKIDENNWGFIKSI